MSHHHQLQVAYRRPTTVPGGGRRYHSGLPSGILFPTGDPRAPNIIDNNMEDSDSSSSSDDDDINNATLQAENLELKAKNTALEAKNTELERACATLHTKNNADNDDMNLLRLGIFITLCILFWRRLFWGYHWGLTTPCTNDGLCFWIHLCRQVTVLMIAMCIFGPSGVWMGHKIDGVSSAISAISNDVGYLAQGFSLISGFIWGATAIINSLPHTHNNPNRLFVDDGDSDSLILGSLCWLFPSLTMVCLFGFGGGGGEEAKSAISKVAYCFGLACLACLLQNFPFLVISAFPPGYFRVTHLNYAAVVV